MVRHVLLGLILLAGSAQASEDMLPFVGNRVRVMAPRIGEGWQVGMFNMLRVDPACYRVLLFSGNRVSATLSARDIERLQVSIQPDGQNRPYRPGPDQPAEEQWREISLEALRAAERQCRFAD